MRHYPIFLDMKDRLLAAGREIDHAHKSAPGIFLFHGLARRAKSGSRVAVGHRFRIRGNHPPDNSLDRLY